MSWTESTIQYSRGQKVYSILGDGKYSTVHHSRKQKVQYSVGQKKVLYSRGKYTELLGTASKALLGTASKLLLGTASKALLGTASKALLETASKALLETASKALSWTESIEQYWLLQKDQTVLSIAGAKYSTVHDSYRSVLSVTSTVLDRYCP